VEGSIGTSISGTNSIIANKKRGTTRHLGQPVTGQVCDRGSHV